MSDYLLLALFELFLVALPSVASLWRLRTARNSTPYHTFLKYFVLVVALFFAAFMVAFEMQWIDWLWYVNETVVYRVVAIFYVVFLPWSVYGFFNLVDLIGEKRKPCKHWRLRCCLGAPLMVVCALMLFGGFLNRHRLVVEHVEVVSERLPERFDGMKIAVLSDIHLGTLVGDKDAYLQAVVDSVNALQPDLIFFVGDLVSVSANEMLEYHNILHHLEAKVGKYAVMGNHDYGGYFPFNSEAELSANEERMHEKYKACGFHLLINEGVEIVYDEDNMMNIVGIEGWGRGRFPKLGNLDDAMNTVNQSAYTILLSHDPTIWRPLVYASNYYVDLTVSGHTHGGQVILFGLSPIMAKIEFWNGLYSEGEQYIYVSRGIGYTILPMRVGKGPEISLIQLRKSRK